MPAAAHTSAVTAQLIQIGKGSLPKFASAEGRAVQESEGREQRCSQEVTWWEREFDVARTMRNLGGNARKFAPTTRGGRSVEIHRDRADFAGQRQDEMDQHEGDFAEGREDPEHHLEATDHGDFARGQRQENPE